MPMSAPLEVVAFMRQWRGTSRQGFEPPVKPGCGVARQKRFPCPRTPKAPLKVFDDA